MSTHDESLDITYKKSSEILSYKKPSQKTKIVKSKKVDGFLYKHLFEVQEKERQKLARDLHDGIGQSLTILKFKIDALQDIFSVNMNDKVKDELLSMKVVLINTMDEIRNICKNLGPELLDELGLKAAMRSITSELIKRNRINIIIDDSDIRERFSKEIEIVLYRILQEALHNIEKHSDAKNVEIVIRVKGEKVEMTIKDDGKGFDTSKKITGFGLLNMRERTELVMGQFKVKSALTEGTVLSVKIPLIF